ncbi:MAG: hypothetical protein HOL15_09660 [Nitrospinaceae bacterium]|nr:hypothetical protein [Nitrospinaceae bacterium]
MFKSRITQFAANLLIVIVLYGNLDLMFQMWGVRIHRDTLPNIWYLENLFYIHAVFTETNVYSREFAAFGVDTRFEEAPAMPDENMIDLNIHQYFPQQRGKANQAMALAGYIWDPERQNQSYQVMADYIQGFYNAKNPNRSVEQAFIYVVWWPGDKGGYHKRYSERQFRLLGHN